MTRGGWPPGQTHLAAPAQAQARSRTTFVMHWPQMARHMLGLRTGLPGARRWRQVLSDHGLKDQPIDRVFALAQGEVSLPPA